MTSIAKRLDENNRRPQGAPPASQVKELLAYTRARLRARRPESVAPTTSAVPSATAIKSFYNSWQWKRLRYAFLKDRERKCQCCGAGPETRAKIVVDHIKSIRHFWSLRLDPKNLQVFCDDCNRGKGSHDASDFRATEQRIG